MGCFSTEFSATANLHSLADNTKFALINLRLCTTCKSCGILITKLRAVWVVGIEVNYRLIVFFLFVGYIKITLFVKTEPFGLSM